MYVKPRERCLKRYVGWILVWQPMLRTVYRARGKRDILWEFVIPSLTGDELCYILLSRRNRYKYSDSPPHRGAEFPYPAPTPEEVFRAVNKIYLETAEEGVRLSRSELFTIALMKVSSTQRLYREREEKVERALGMSISRRLLRTMIKDGLGLGEAEPVLREHSLVRYPLLFNGSLTEIVDPAAKGCGEERRYTQYLVRDQRVKRFYMDVIKSFL